ncbi:MAG: tetratricopeptide repeat protein [Clostridia bacterium]|nr:tetratricopeptide repeat protein [Clostridia bacterium]
MNIIFNGILNLFKIFVFSIIFLHSNTYANSEEISRESSAKVAYDYAVEYANSANTVHEYKKIVELYIKASELGSAKASRDLGSMYQYGHWVSRDNQKAYEWYKKAAQQGDQYSKDKLLIEFKKEILEESRLKKDSEKNIEDKSWGWEVWIGIVIAVVFWFITVPVGIGYFVYQYDPLLGVLSGILTFLFIYFKFLRGCTGEKCPECKKCCTNVIKKELIGQHYKHETKTGEPDKRYKENPLYSTYRYSYQCENNDCGEKFIVDKDEVT